MEPVDDLQLPRLPTLGWTPEQFQVWWQIVVDRIEASINGLNLAIAGIIAGEERAAMAEAQIAALLSMTRSLKSMVAMFPDQFAGVEQQLAQGFGMGDRHRRDITAGQAALAVQRARIDELEIVAWLL